MNLLDLASRDVKLKRAGSTSGGEFVGACPFCQDGTDRFHVWPNRKPKARYWCRICNARGDIIDYVRGTRGLDYKGAMEFLGRPLDTLPRPAPLTPTAQKPKPDDEKKFLVWRELVGEFIIRCQEHLWMDIGKPARDYLHNRGLQDETIRRAMLGYNPRGQRVASEWAQRGITIPWTHDGELTHVSIRRPLKEEPKYVSIECPVKPSKILFYVPGDRQVLCIVEGEFDCLLLHQETGLSVVLQ